MHWKEKTLIRLQKQYGAIAIFGIHNNAHKLVDFLGEKLVDKYINSFLLSKMCVGQAFFCNVPIENVQCADFVKEGLVIIASELSVKNEIEEILHNNGYKNTIHVSEFYLKIEDNYIAKYISDFAESRPLFRTIEIETINRCNGICEFCPVNRNEKQRPYHKMTTEMFESIIEQLAELEYKGTVSLFSNNEPFIDERIIDFAAYTRKKLPEAKISVYTNGTLLTEEKYRNIISYLDVMWIDVYVTKENPDVPEHIQKIMNVAKLEGWDEKTTLSIVKYDMVRFSRAGNSPNSKVNYILQRPCILPYAQMVIRPDGKASLCCNDALGQMTLGDLQKECLTDIWYGDRYNKIRKQLAEGRENVSLCKYCNYVQDLDFMFYK